MHWIPVAAIVPLLGVPVSLRRGGIALGKPALNLSIIIYSNWETLKIIDGTAVYWGALTWLLQLTHIFAIACD